jgi:hypothetical protein
LLLIIIIGYFSACCYFILSIFKKVLTAHPLCPLLPCYCFVACFVAWVVVGTSTHDTGVQVMECGTFETNKLNFFGHSIFLNFVFWFLFKLFFCLFF